MRRALRIGIFIGTLIGVSACATVEAAKAHAPVAAEAVRTF